MVISYILHLLVKLHGQNLTDLIETKLYCNKQPEYNSIKLKKS